MNVTDGWDLGTGIGRPLITGPGDLCAEITDAGMLQVSGWDEVQGAVTIPLLALKALMAAHECWLKVAHA